MNPWRWLLLMALVGGGCVATLPINDPTLSADFATETARMVASLRQTIPPTPVSDDCENCNGTGKIGDGRIVHTCPTCGGTGKRK